MQGGCRPASGVVVAVTAELQGRLIWKQLKTAATPAWVPYIRELAPDTSLLPHSTILFDMKTSLQAKVLRRELVPDASES